jgi:Tfp pilus assembly protein PilX
LVIDRSAAFVMVIVSVGMMAIVRVRMLIGSTRIGHLSIYEYIEFRRGNSAAIDSADTQLSPDIQRSYRSLQNLAADACVKQGAKHHVSTNSREAFEIGYAHILLLSFRDSAVAKFCPFGPANTDFTRPASVRHPDLLDRQHRVHRA